MRLLPDERGAAEGALRGAGAEEPRGAADGDDRGAGAACGVVLVGAGARVEDGRLGAAGCSRAEGAELRDGLASGVGARGASAWLREDPRDVGAALEPRSWAAGRSGAGLRGASRSEGRASPPPFDGSRGAALGVLGAGAVGVLALGVCALGARALGVRALGSVGSRTARGNALLGRGADGRSLAAGPLPTAGAARPDAGVGAAGVALGLRSAPPIPSVGRGAGRSVGLTARGVDALGPRRSMAGRRWGAALAAVRSPVLAGDVAGEAAGAADGLRTAVRTTEPRASSLYVAPARENGDGRT